MAGSLTRWVLTNAGKLFAGELIEDSLNPDGAFEGDETFGFSRDMTDQAGLVSVGAAAHDFKGFGNVLLSHKGRKTPFVRHVERVQT